jgi:beta-lactamase superfamily II metal-dependent hydrolase
MATQRYIDDDIVRVYEFGKPKKEENLLATLFWGDSVRVMGTADGLRKLEFNRRRYDAAKGKYVWDSLIGAIPTTARFRDEPLLKVRFIDVGQGDASIIESPSGQMIILDGGEGPHLTNYMSAAWSYLLKTKPIDCAAIVVTHGDADHFAGLPRLAASLKTGKGLPGLSVKRVYHNGLVKGGEDLSELKRFGKTVDKDGETFIVDLVDDLRDAAASRMNATFAKWVDAIKGFGKKSAVKVRRVEYGDDGAFDFLEDEGIRIEVMGPIVETVQNKPALRFLRDPKSNGKSASHTINGHSVVLKLSFGNVRFLFGADLNQQSENLLLERARNDGRSLAAEVLKVPHHGSADFSPRMLESIRAVVSVVSSGDESTAKEYIHPRAGLVGALGKYSRATVEKPLIYVTEMVAFFERLGRVSVHEFSKTDRNKELAAATEVNNAYSKKQFGIVHVRTDGTRVLVATHSGKAKDKESYVFSVDEQGDISFTEEPRIVG